MERWEEKVIKVFPPPPLPLCLISTKGSCGEALYTTETTAPVRLQQTVDTDNMFSPSHTSGPG